ncbi:MAG: nuclear transport factor 2 family protein [Novosphingobium sp.]
MAYSLEQLSAFEDIRTLKHRYFRAMDTGDAALLGTLFTSDVSIDYRGGTYRVQFEGRDNLLLFLANSFHSDVVAMHHGHMPEITLIDETSAEGIWYLEDIFIDTAEQRHTIGTAIYRDRYRREADGCKIAHSEYDRVIELNMPLSPDIRIGSRRLAETGLRPEQRSDIAHLIRWGAPVDALPA